MTTATNGQRPRSLIPLRVSGTTVWHTVRLPGFHRWPDAPDSRSYLRYPHRHLFAFTVFVSVGHDNRDVEFHDLGDAVRGWWGEGSPNRDGQSCEQMAAELGGWLHGQYRWRIAAVEVSEDDESGAVVLFEQDDFPPGQPDEVPA